MPSERESSPYQLFILGLCLYALAALAVQTVFTLDRETTALLDIVDTGVCAVFFLDFIRSLVRADHRFQYLVTWGQLDLISSIPEIDLFRWGRAARVFRILRVLRGLRATRVISFFVLERRAESGLWAALLFAPLVVTFGSIAILHLERAAEGNIQTAGDALWWAFVTLTTVGYGDHFPVTPAGRLIAVFLMATGIELFDTLTAFLASAFLAPGGDEVDGEISALREEIHELRRELSVRDR